MKGENGEKSKRRDQTDTGRPRSIDSVGIAKMVGVARSTVSKVLNGYPNISERTRERVLAAVRQYQYYPNLSAQVLAGKHVKTLGLFFVTAGSFSGDILTNFMLSRVIESAAAVGYHVLTYIIHNFDDQETGNSVREVFFQNRVSAGIFIGARDREPVIEELIASGFVVGVFDESPAGRKEPNRVIVNLDDEQTAKAVITYLHRLGHRRIAIINGDQKRNAGRAKKRGFEAGLRACGLRALPEWTAESDFTETGGYTQMKKLLSANGWMTRLDSETQEAPSQDPPEHRRPLPTSLAAVNDNVAFGVIRALDEAGISVPAQVSVAGMDGHPLGPHTHPPLTTFSFDFSEMVSSLTVGVVRVVEGRSPDAPPDRTGFRARLIERESCAPRLNE